MDLIDRLPKIEGVAQFTVYEGDVEYGDRVVRMRPHEEPDGHVIYIPEREILNPVLHISTPVHNLVTTVGKDLILNRLFSTTVVNAIDATNGNMGVGTVSTAAAAGDTQLNTGGGGSSFLQVFDATFPSRAAEVVTVQTTYGTGVANFAWAECGLFNGPTNGTSTLFDRIAPIGPFTKSASVSIILKITVTQS